MVDPKTVRRYFEEQLAPYPDLMTIAQIAEHWIQSERCFPLVSHRPAENLHTSTQNLYSQAVGARFSSLRGLQLSRPQKPEALRCDPGNPLGGASARFTI